jgi:hypothetical protein
MRALVEAKVIVRIFNDTIGQGHDRNSAVLLRRLRDRAQSQGRSPRPNRRERYRNVYSGYQLLRYEWERLPVDGVLKRQR